MADSRDCACPDVSILTTIPAQTCSFDLKQLQRVILFEQGEIIFDSTGGVSVPNPPATLDISKKADWDTLLALADSHKAIITPLIGGDPQIVAGEPITEGGNDNSTLNGEELITGVGSAIFSANFKGIEPAIERALQAAGCKTIEAIFVNADGDFVAHEITPGSATYTGFKLTSYFFSDRANSGFGTKDQHEMRFSLAPGWSNNLVKIDAEAGFNPLYDI